ncbi:MAG: putative toxin-antitoxin system toxin component, PIN family [Dehalococcoidia bacterium]
MPLAVVDTNVWISALLNPEGYPARVVRALLRGEFELIVTPSLLAELENVSRRPRLERIGLRIEDATALAELIRENGYMVAEPSVVPICRDPRDDVFIAAAASAMADFLVTRDDDLKSDDSVRDYLAGAGVTVLSVQHFLEQLETAGDSPPS